MAMCTARGKYIDSSLCRFFTNEPGKFVSYEGWWKILQLLPPPDVAKHLRHGSCTEAMENVIPDGWAVNIAL